jgi:hypothetical protein
MILIACMEGCCSCLRLLLCAGSQETPRAPSPGCGKTGALRPKRHANAASVDGPPKPLEKFLHRINALIIFRKYLQSHENSRMLPQSRPDQGDICTHRRRGQAKTEAGLK